jgi:hypothetical protein
VDRSHDHLSFIVDSNKENPGKAKDKKKAIQGQKRGDRVLLSFFYRLIEPEHLAEDNKENRGIARIEEESK